MAPALAATLLLAVSPACAAADVEDARNISPVVTDAIAESEVSAADDVEPDVTLSARQRRKVRLGQARQARREERREARERAGTPQAAASRPVGVAAAPLPVASTADIKVAFKLDPRLTRGLYMGDRWVTPRVYSGVHEGVFTVEAQAHGHDAGGSARGDRPPLETSRSGDRVGLRGPGNAVTITVHRAGDSVVRVAVENEAKEIVVSKELPIKAWYRGTALAAEIDTSRAVVKGSGAQDRSPARKGWKVVDESGAEIRTEPPSRPVVTNGWRVVE